MSSNKSVTAKFNKIAKYKLETFADNGKIKFLSNGVPLSAFDNENVKVSFDKGSQYITYRSSNENALKNAGYGIEVEGYATV